MNKKWLLLFFWLCAPLFATSTWAKSIAISNIFVREMLPGSKVTAGYFILANNSDKPIHLQSVSSTLAPRIEIHQHTMENGMMKMAKIDGDIVIKPDDELVFQPGGYHLMIFEPTIKIKKGVSFTLVFNFKDKESMAMQGKVVSVLDLAAQTIPHSHHH